MTTPDGGEDRRRPRGTDAAMAAILAEHADRLDAITQQMEAMALPRQGEQQAVADLRQLVQSLLEQEEERRGYVPVPAPHWWDLEGTEREDAIAHLREWVDKVFRPGYEQVADDLGPCWAQHPICLYLLDFLSEWHRYLYLAPKRPAGHLGAMAEWHTRFLPVAIEVMRDTTKACQHRTDEAIAREGALFHQAPPAANGHAGRNGHGGRSGSAR